MLLIFINEKNDTGNHFKPTKMTAVLQIIYLKNRIELIALSTRIFGWKKCQMSLVVEKYKSEKSARKKVELLFFI